MPKNKKSGSYSSHKYIINNVKYKSLKEISKKFNIANSTLYSRLQSGMSIEEAVSQPIKKVGKRLYNKKG